MGKSEPSQRPRAKTLGLLLGRAAPSLYPFRKTEFQARHWPRRADRRQDILFRHPAPVCAPQGIPTAGCGPVPRAHALAPSAAHASALLRATQTHNMYQKKGEQVRLREQRTRSAPGNGPPGPPVTAQQTVQPDSRAL